MMPSLLSIKQMIAIIVLSYDSYMSPKLKRKSPGAIIVC